MANVRWFVLDTDRENAEGQPYDGFGTYEEAVRWAKRSKIVDWAIWKEQM